MSRAPRLEIWTSLACDGGTYLAPLPVASATLRESLTGQQDALQAVVASADPVASLLARGRCVRLVGGSAATVEWIITGVTDAEGEQDGAVQVTAQPGAATLLAWRGLVRGTDTNLGNRLAFTVTRETRASVLSVYLGNNAVTDGTAWLSVGTIENDQPVSFSFDALTRWQLLQQTARGRDLVLRRVGETGYAVDLLARRGSTAARFAWVGRQLRRLERQQASDQYATRVRVYGRTRDGALVPDTMAENAWTVGTPIGSGPWWVPLTDPAGFDPPVRVDEQVTGWWLGREDGGTTEILASRASDSAVQVASLTGLVTGERVQIVRSNTWARVLGLRHPARETAGPVVDVVVTDSTLGGQRNLVRNPLFDAWAGLESPVGWTWQGGTGVAARYPRTTAPSYAGVVTDGITAGTATSATLRGLPAHAILYRGDSIVGIPGPRAAQIAATAQANGTGVITVSLVAPFGGGPIPDGTAATLATGGRPIDFPADTGAGAVPTDVARLLTLNTDTTTIPPATTLRFQSAPFTVVPAPQLSTVYAEVGLTLDGSAANEDAANLPVAGPGYLFRKLPAVRIQNVTANTVADQQVVTDIVSGTLHRTVRLLTVVGAPTALAVAVIPAGSPLGTYVRYASLWLGQSGTEATPLFDGSRANELWQRANERLLALGGTRYAIRWADTAALFDVTAPIALGDALQLRASRLGVDATVRVVGITWDLVAPENSTLDIDIRPDSLADVLAALTGGA